MASGAARAPIQTTVCGLDSSCRGRVGAMPGTIDHAIRCVLRGVWVTRGIAFGIWLTREPSRRACFCGATAGFALADTLQAAEIQPRPAKSAPLAIGLDAGNSKCDCPATRAERRYRAVDPDNRLVARGLEREWEQSLSALETAMAELARRERQRPRLLAPEERDHLLSIGPDLARVWHAPTTTPRDRKELLGALIDEVIIKVERDKAAAHLTIRWNGGALDEIDLALPRSRPATIRTDEDTIALVRRLARHYPDTVITGILNRQGRTTAYGHRFEAGHVGNLRRHWDIPCFEPKADTSDGGLLTVKKAAAVLGVAPSTIHRLLNDGIIAGEQLTPGAPWRIRLTDEIMARFNGEAGDGFMPMREAMRVFGVSRQTVLQRVKRGELAAVHVMRGKQKGLRIKGLTPQPELFSPAS